MLWLPTRLVKGFHQNIRPASFIQSFSVCHMLAPLANDEISLEMKINRMGNLRSAVDDNLLSRLGISSSVSLFFKAIFRAAWSLIVVALTSTLPIIHL